MDQVRKFWDKFQNNTKGTICPYWASFYQPQLSSTFS